MYIIFTNPSLLYVNMSEPKLTEEIKKLCLFGLRTLQFRDYRIFETRLLIRLESKERTERRQV